LNISLKLLIMKSIQLLIAFFIASLLFVPVNETKAQAVNVNLSLFQNELGPHGRWLNNPRFGQVWIYNDASFRPYATDGHWEYTNYGWSWVSDFDWGWAPFHYGRWEYDPSFGWMWIPGYEWASAWVSWSQYDGYYGWAPLGDGVNINVSFGAVPYDRWNFIPRQYMGSRDFYRHYASPRNNYFRNAVVINNYYNGNEGRFTRGPERREVERYTNNRIEERHIDYRARLVNRNDQPINGRADVINNNRGGNNNPRQETRNDNRRPVTNAPVNNLPQNQPAINNRGNNNIPDRPQNNFPDNRQNQIRDNNNNNWKNNNNERPQQQARPQAQPVQQERNQQDWRQQNQQGTIQQRQQPAMEQRRIERPQGGNNDRQNQPSQRPGNGGGRRSERD
jgi:hypothetical protein